MGFEKIIKDHSWEGRIDLRGRSDERPLISSPLNLIQKHESFSANSTMGPSMINHGPMTVDSLNDRTMSRPFH